MIPTFRKSLDVFISHFVHTFDVSTFLGFEEKLSNWLADKLNSNVQSCFETFVDKYLKLWELKTFHAFRFLWFILVHEKTERMKNYELSRFQLFVNKRYKTVLNTANQLVNHSIWQLFLKVKKNLDSSTMRMNGILKILLEGLNKLSLVKILLRNENSIFSNWQKKWKFSCALFTNVSIFNSEFLVRSVFSHI